MPAWIRAGLVSLLLLVGRPATAQLSDHARISLITIYPGNQLHTLFGHSAVRVDDPLRGIDSSFNYGTFDFDEWFVFKFVYGKLDYKLDVHDFDHAFRFYREVERRSVVEQVLDLTPAQRDSLYRFLLVNARPENRYYRYDFLFDNCSTRIRDALERTVGVRFAEASEPRTTFRQLLDPYLAGRPFLDTGINWLFGAPVDRDARAYEAMFLPLGLMEEFGRASVRYDGSWRPLVARTDTLFWLDENETADLPWARIAAWLLFAAGVGVTYYASTRNSSVVRTLDVPLFTLTGLAGLLIVFLWFISLHDVTVMNWHLLWAWPSHLVAAYALAGRRPWINRYLLAASIATLIAVASSPLWPQDFHPALYPLALLTAMRGGWIALTTRRESAAA